MKNEFRMVIVLTLIITIAGCLLAYTYVSTQDDIQRNLENSMRTALLLVVEGVESYENIALDEKTSVLKAKDSNGNVIGYGVMITGGGFQGDIKLMVGFDKDASAVLGIEVLENVETPGLGNRIIEDWFKKQFEGAIPPIEVLKGQKPQNRSQIEAITGATISSKSVANIINNAHKALETYLGSGGGGESAGRGEEEILEYFEKRWPEKRLIKKGTYYVINDKSGQSISYGIFSEGVEGGDTVKIFMTVSKNFSKIEDIVIMNGSEVSVDKEKLDELQKRLIGESLPLSSSNVEVVTGATIIEDGVVSAVNKGFEALKKELK